VIWEESYKREIIIEQLRNGSGIEFETKYIKKTGEIGTVLAKVDIIELDGIEYALICGSDITKRKKAEEALRVSEDKFSKAFHNSKAIMTLSRLKDGVYVDVNNAWAETLGYEREELLGKSALEFETWAEPAQRQTMVEQVSKYWYLTNFECNYKKKSGEVGYALSSINIIIINGEKHILITAIDITEMKKYENEMKRLDSLNLIGQMAGSIAHEIRNPMTSIKGFLQLFHEQNNYREDLEAIELMIEEIDRVNVIITTFLSLSKSNHIDLKEMKLSDCISNTLQLISADAVKNDVFLNINLKDISRIMIDKGEIRQLLLNLARNAIEAMPSGGTLTVLTFEDESGITLVVRDEGGGIPPEIAAKIWTPFVTTKEDGTGLGIPVCRSIAERHNATITFDTSPEGTSFKVTFPVAAIEAV
ncbi:MAG: PAS domain S-box protein, partial [Syntrophomonas sp.]|nr:PAS domain S-box protein [Syntrophomonas sp.]